VAVKCLFASVDVGLVLYTGPALANQRPWSNFPPSLPFSLSLSLLFFPLPSLPLRTAKRPLKNSCGIYGSAVSSLNGVWGGAWLQSHFAALYARKTEFLGSKFVPPPLKFVALFGRTPRTCLRPALTIQTVTWTALINIEHTT